MSEKTTIARPYAVAVFEQARQEGALQRWSEMLAVAAAIVKDPMMATLLASPLISREQLAGLIIEVGGECFAEGIKNLIYVLAANDRFLVLPEIAASFDNLKAEVEKRVDVEVVSAYAIDATQEHILTQALEKRFGRTVNITISIDQDLIGGAVVHMGDVVIDGSLRAGLTQMANELRH
jgi:F-type H+-transporting ATPase subunit delta